MNLIQIFEKFPTREDCIEHLEKVRWRGAPFCTYCKSDRVSPMPTELRHHCNNCKTSFSVTVGMIFHHTHLPLQKWFLAIALVLDAKKALSARQLARDLEVNKNTGWLMATQIRKAMEQRDQRDLLIGIIEVAETYIGGNPRKGGIGSGGQDDGRNPRGRGTNKHAVAGMIKRDGKVRPKSLERRTCERRGFRRWSAATSSSRTPPCLRMKMAVMSASRRTRPNHRTWYVAEERTHTNSIESFWVRLKRGILGKYHKVSLRHLPRGSMSFCISSIIATTRTCSISRSSAR